MAKKNATEIKYKFIKILTGSDLSIRRLSLIEADSKKEGPTVWLTGAVHGDEVGGIVVIQEIFNKLKKSPLLKGKLMAFPLMNPIAFESATRSIPLSEEDLNRSFPGNPHGSVAERISNTIFTVIKNTNPALVLDLHNDWVKSIPYTLIDPNPRGNFEKAYLKAREISFKTGFLVINEAESEAEKEILKSTLSGSLISSGTPALTLELGESYVVNEKNVEDGVIAIWKVLSSLGMVDGVSIHPNYEVPHNLEGKILNYSHRPVSSKTGIIRFLKKPGEILKKGTAFAKIHNVIGKHKETLKTEEDSILLGLTDSAAALPGIPIAAFGYF